METGLRSYRCKVFDKFPRTNIPDLYSSWGEFENYVKLLIHTNCIDDAKKIWWDIRPHPYFPTLEFRVCDMPMRLEESIALAALCQAIIAKLYRLHERNQSFRHYGRALIMENKWRAARYGLEGKMIDFGKQTEVPARQLIGEIMEVGNGADRQLRVHHETGDFKKVVDYMIAETEFGLFAPGGSG
jgi:carboxylate-amine ligase